MELLRKQSQADSHAKSIIENALKKAFAPEFLNRVDDVMVFNTLEREHIHKIIDIELDKLFDRILDLGYKLSLTEKAKDLYCRQRLRQRVRCKASEASDSKIY